MDPVAIPLCHNTPRAALRIDTGAKIVVKHQQPSPIFCGACTGDAKAARRAGTHGSHEITLVSLAPRECPFRSSLTAGTCSQNALASSHVRLVGGSDDCDGLASGITMPLVNVGLRRWVAGKDLRSEVPATRRLLSRIDVPGVGKNLIPTANDETNRDKPMSILRNPLSCYSLQAARA